MKSLNFSKAIIPVHGWLKSMNRPSIMIDSERDCDPKKNPEKQISIKVAAIFRASSRRGELSSLLMLLNLVMKGFDRFASTIKDPFKNPKII